MIKLRTLGECVIEIGGEAFTPESDALFAALLYLCVERGKRVARDHLAELIWPRTTAKRARHCLRQILYRLRMLGVEFEGARESVMLLDAAVEPTFSAAPAPDRLAAARSAGTLVLGPFLPGYRPPHSEPYAEWLDATRAEIESRVRRSLLELAQVHRLRGEWADVDALARECIRLDPLNEEANLAIAEAAAMTGGKSEAIAILDRYIHDLGARGNDLRLPATVLRRRIAERFPARRYSVPSDRCFVGRAGLLETLATALLRARNGESSALMLTGAPGIGKTRLVQELTSLAVMQGVRTVRVGCDEADAQRPMSAWVDAVPRLRELPGALGIAPESLRFLRRLTEIDPTDAVLAEPLRDPRWIANRIRQAIVDLLDAVTAEGTVLLVIEDVHWLDGPSWAAITALLEWMRDRRFLLVLTTRGPLARDGAPTRCLERVPVHVVPPLEGAASRHLGELIATDHGGVLTAEALEWCVEVGEGNPLFVRELVAHCLEGGAPHAVPPTIQVLIDGRIARLERPTRRILEAAAILGGLSNVTRVERMLDMPTHELASGLEELGESLLLSDSSPAVAPRHELVRSRVMATMSNPVRFLLHRRAALVLEDELATDVTPEAAYALIDHWRAAQSDARCVPAILHAATHFMRLGVPRDAADLLARSRSLLGDTNQSRAALALHMRALALTAQWRLAHDVAHELTTVPGGSEADGTTAAAQLVLLEAGFRIGNDPDLLYRSALTLASNRQTRPADRIAAARLGIMIAESSSSALDQRELWRAVSDLRNGGDELAIEIGMLEMIYEINLGTMGDGIASADRLLNLLAETRDGYQRLSMILPISDALRVGGRYGDALKLAYDGTKLARETGSEHFEISALSRVIAIHTEIGELREAQALLPELEARVHQSADEFARLTTYALSARIALFTGQTDEAKSWAIRHYDIVRASAFDSRDRVRIAVTLLAEVLLSCGPQPLPAALLEELRAAHLACRTRPMHDQTMAVLYSALVRSGYGDHARDVLDEYLLYHRRAMNSWPESVARLKLAGIPELETASILGASETVPRE